MNINNFRKKGKGFNVNDLMLRKKKKKGLNRRRRQVRSVARSVNQTSREQGYGRVRTVVYGQNRDLAFGQGYKPSVISAPISESTVLRSSFSFSNDILSFTQPIPTWFYNSNMAIIPLHPMLYYGRTSNIAGNFYNFQLVRAVVHYVPLIGTTSTGMVAIGSTQNCAPITQDTANQFSSLTLLNSEISSVWMCSKHVLRDVDNGIKMSSPVTRKDVPNTVYVVGSGLAGTLISSCTLFLQVSFKLSRPSPTVDLTAGSGLTSLVISGAGIAASTIRLQPSFGIVVASTVPNIDVGELLVVPGFLAATPTVYPTSILHNSTETDYNTVSDQGTVYFLTVYAT
jgi:hypothetical protein